MPEPVVDLLATSVPLLLVAATAGFLAVLVSRALRDATVIEAVRIEVRRLGETHRAVCESRALRPGLPPAPERPQRRRG